MMTTTSFISQPNDGCVVEQISRIAKSREWNTLLVSVAYATQSGSEQLIGALRAMPNFDKVRKRFLVGLDFGLTEPSAIRYLQSLANSRCRLFEPKQTLRAALRPAIRFHPKVYAFGSSSTIRESDAAAGIIGSANLTGSGLTTNIEAAVAFHADLRNEGSKEWRRTLQQLAVRVSNQPQVDEETLQEYEAARSRVIRSARPESVPGTFYPRRDLDVSYLRALRGAQVLWTQSLNIVANLGRRRPGNQIDLKKGTRVFFGSSVSLDAPQNTELGSITTYFDGATHICNIRYGDNGMDKANLPVPVKGRAYDHSYLIWTRLKSGAFALSVSKREPPEVRRSRDRGTLFSYGRGQRSWGFC